MSPGWVSDGESGWKWIHIRKESMRLSSFCPKSLSEDWQPCREYLLLLQFIFYESNLGLLHSVKGSQVISWDLGFQLCTLRWMVKPTMTTYKYLYYESTSVFFRMVVRNTGLVYHICTQLHKRISLPFLLAETGVMSNYEEGSSYSFNIPHCGKGRFYESWE